MPQRQLCGSLQTPPCSSFSELTIRIPPLSRPLHRPQVPVHRQCVHPRPHSNGWVWRPWQGVFCLGNYNNLAVFAPCFRLLCMPLRLFARSWQYRHLPNRFLLLPPALPPGTVHSTKMKRTITIRRDYLHYVSKYQRCAPLAFLRCIPPHCVSASVAPPPAAARVHPDSRREFCSVLVGEACEGAGPLAPSSAFGRRLRRCLGLCLEARIASFLSHTFALASRGPINNRQRAAPQNDSLSFTPRLLCHAWLGNSCEISRAEERKRKT